MSCRIGSPGAELTVSSVTLSASYDPGVWSVGGRLTTKSASWNYSGDVPYIPDMEVAVEAGWTVLDVWRLRGSAHLYGKHHVERGSTDTEDSFLVVDVGVDRDLWLDYVSAFIDLRNLTDAEGSWWSEEYRVPGIGLYAGVHAHY